MKTVKELLIEWIESYDGDIVMPESHKSLQDIVIEQLENNDCDGLEYEDEDGIQCHCDVDNLMWCNMCDMYCKAVKEE